MRVYEAKIEAYDTRYTDSEGKYRKVTFTWYVVYPFKPADARGQTPERERERDAKYQISEMMPHIFLPKVLWSRCL